jgi:capsular exopolysaccharide synthesis family protein
LSGNSTFEEIVQKSEKSDNLSIIASGPNPPNPSELILSGRMKELMTELKQHFDKIIIDTPPVGLVSDGLLLEKYADNTLFVVRDGVTRKNHIKQADGLYQQGQLKNAGIVFNAVRKRNTGYGYSGYGYGYVYGSDYGNYFDDRTENKGLLKRWLYRFKKHDR